MKLSFSLNLLKNLSERTRLFVSTGVAGLVFLFLPFAQLQLRLLAAWNSGVICFLILVLALLNGTNSEKTCYHTRRQEANHSSIFLWVVLTAFMSLFAIGAVLIENKDTFSLKVMLSVVAIVCSWLLMQTMFALHYATFYYSRNNLDQPVGLTFASGKLPHYWDFMYFTFTLGMTSQTSDTTITSSLMRRLVLGHTLVSFFFYSVILALTVSIVSGII